MMHPFLTVCVLCVVVSTTYGTMNIALLIRKAEEEHYKLKDRQVREITTPGPPPHEEAARMARYIVHNSGKLFKMNVH